MVANTLRLHPKDNVIVALQALEIGARLSVDEKLNIGSSIAKGHKIATSDINLDQAIYKYNQIIGFASKAIKAGDHVHTHNCGMGDFDRDYAFGSAAEPVKLIAPENRRTFQGYQRASGKAGTRNYIGLIASVNCSATSVRFIADKIKHSGVLDNYPNIDGVVPIYHSTGCGMAGSGEGFDNLKRVIKGYTEHANFGGILLMGLGCEVMQLKHILQEEDEHQCLRQLTIQSSGGTSKAIADGVEAVTQMLATVNDVKRQTLPISELTIALQCGGSDAYSGITANPALGRAADLLVEQGGTAILSETSEVFGAEHLLTRRAVSQEVGQKLVDRIHWWEDYTAKHGGNMNNNPSPGNLAGGLTTILEKSLGAVAKGGSTPMQGVYLYAEQIDTKGFVFMDSPGYDPCSVTGQVAAGANIVCFTTGRGSAFGFKPVPSIKLATNSQMFQFQEEDMDINCGDIIDGGSSIDDKAKQILDYIISTASGELSKSEALGYGDSEFVPWQIGAVM